MTMTYEQFRWKIGEQALALIREFEDRVMEVSEGPGTGGSVLPQRIEDMETGSELRRAVWDLLGMVRGPDSDDCDDKHQTVAVFRSMLFPRLAESCGAMENNDPQASPMDYMVEQARCVHRGERPGRRIDGHFADHVRIAARWFPWGDRSQQTKSEDKED